MVRAAPALPYDGPPHFHRRLRGGIRKIGRKFGFPRHELWDFVHSVWLRVHDRWLRVPRVEPSHSRYIFKIARNLAIDIRKQLDDDLMGSSVLFSQLPEADDDGPAEVPGKRPTWKKAVWQFQADLEDAQRDDKKGTPQIVQLTIEDRIRAHRLWDQAFERDREAAGWLAHYAVGGETFVEVGELVGQPVERVKKRVSRLIDKLEA